MQQQIPDLVAERVLAVRRRTYASNAEMQERRAQRGDGLSPEMRTILEAAGMSPDDFKIDNSGFTTKPLVLDKELQFWAMDDDEELEEFLSGDLMPALLDASPEQSRQLPAGYEPLTLVLEFERHSQFEGWYAVENRAEDMPGIINGYHFLGLADEARALAVVAKAHRAMASDDPEAIEDVLPKVYATVPNATPEFEDRMPIIFAFVRSHPELFHSARTMP